MPYIDAADRDDLDQTPLEHVIPRTKGELTYAIFKLQRQFMLEQPQSYDSLSDAVGAATDAANEFRRRFLDPYEDRKRDLNGDVNA